MLLIIFGQPGAGKTYVGKVISRMLGFIFRDGDGFLTPELRRVLVGGGKITQSMRNRYVDSMFRKIMRVRAAHPGVPLVLSQTFLKERFRRKAIELFPDARFILVQAKPAIRRARLAVRRSKIRLAGNYLRTMERRFEPPRIPYVTIQNDTPVDAAIVRQLTGIFQKENYSIDNM